MVFTTHIAEFEDLFAFKMRYLMPLFLYFHLYNACDSMYISILPMGGF